MMECGMEPHQHVIVSKGTATSMHKNVIIMSFFMHFSCDTTVELMKLMYTDIILNRWIKILITSYLVQLSTVAIYQSLPMEL